MECSSDRKSKSRRGGGAFYVPSQKFKSTGMREGACLVKLKLKETKQSNYGSGQALRIPRGLGSQIQDNRHMKAARLSALRTGRLYCPGNIPGTHLC